MSKQWTITVDVYRFDELAEEEQEKLVEKRRQAEEEDDWWIYDAVEDIVEALEIMGFEVEKARNSNHRAVWFDTGRGSSFSLDGRYSYAKGAVKRLKYERPTDTDLHEAAQALQDAQRRHFYKLWAELEGGGRHGCGIDVRHSDYHGGWWDGDDTEIREAIKQVYEWALGWLRKEEEWYSSDENARSYLEDDDSWYFADGTLASYGPEEN